MARPGLHRLRRLLGVWVISGGTTIMQVLGLNGDSWTLLKPRKENQGPLRITAIKTWHGFTTTLQPFHSCRTTQGKITHVWDC